MGINFKEFMDNDMYENVQSINSIRNRHSKQYVSDYIKYKASDLSFDSTALFEGMSIELTTPVSGEDDDLIKQIQNSLITPEFVKSEEGQEIIKSNYEAWLKDFKSPTQFKQSDDILNDIDESDFETFWEKVGTHRGKDGKFPKDFNIIDALGESHEAMMSVMKFAGIGLYRVGAFVWDAVESSVGGFIGLLGDAAKGIGLISDKAESTEDSIKELKKNDANALILAVFNTLAELKHEDGTEFTAKERLQYLKDQNKSKPERPSDDKLKEVIESRKPENLSDAEKSAVLFMHFDASTKLVRDYLKKLKDADVVMNFDFSTINKIDGVFKNTTENLSKSKKNLNDNAKKNGIAFYDLGSLYTYIDTLLDRATYTQVMALKQMVESMYGVLPKKTTLGNIRGYIWAAAIAATMIVLGPLVQGIAGAVLNYLMSTVGVKTGEGSLAENISKISEFKITFSGSGSGDTEAKTVTLRQAVNYITGDTFTKDSDFMKWANKSIFDPSSIERYKVVGSFLGYVAAVSGTIKMGNQLNTMLNKADMESLSEVVRGSVITFFASYGNIWSINKSVRSLALESYKKAKQDAEKSSESIEDLKLKIKSGEVDWEKLLGSFKSGGIETNFNELANKIKSNTKQLSSVDVSYSAIKKSEKLIGSTDWFGEASNDVIKFGSDVLGYATFGTLAKMGGNEIYQDFVGKVDDDPTSDESAEGLASDVVTKVYSKLTGISTQLMSADTIKEMVFKNNPFHVAMGSIYFLSIAKCLFESPVINALACVNGVGDGSSITEGSENLVSDTKKIEVKPSDVVPIEKVVKSIKGGNLDVAGVWISVGSVKPGGKQIENLQKVKVLDVAFETGSYKLSEDWKKENGTTLLTNALTSLKEKYPSMKIVMLGNADPTGPEGKNQKLSQERANVIWNTFIKSIPGFETSGSIMIKGVGSIYSNSINNDAIKSYKESLKGKNMSTKALLAYINNPEKEVKIKQALSNDRRLELFLCFTEDQYTALQLPEAQKQMSMFIPEKDVINDVFMGDGRTITDFKNPNIAAKYGATATKDVAAKNESMIFEGKIPSFKDFVEFNF